MSFKINLFQKILLVLNIIALLALITVYLAALVNPVHNYWFSFMGLIASLPIIICIGFSGFWFWKKKYWAWLNLGVLLIGIGTYRSLFAFNMVNNQLDAGIRIMSYNVQNFDLYNWNHNQESRDKILEIIKKQKPDIVCFQEFYTESGGAFDNISRIKEMLGLKHLYFHRTTVLKETHQWGLATFSRYPILSFKNITFPNSSNNGAVLTNLLINQDTLTLINVHLQSIQFRNPDYAYLQHVGQQKPDLNQSRHIAGKLKRAFIARAVQAKLLAESLQKIKHKLILCGDFNDTPVSFAYHTLSKNMQDAFLKKGFGFGATYAGSLPLLRIDYLLFGKYFRINGFRIIHETYSDHYPIIASFSIKQ